MNQCIEQQPFGTVLARVLNDTRTDTSHWTCLQQETAYAKKALELMGSANGSMLAQEMAATAAASTANLNRPVGGCSRTVVGTCPEPGREHRSKCLR